LGAGIGAYYPKFSYDHVAEISTGSGGIICMIITIDFVGAGVTIEAWPI